MHNDKPVLILPNPTNAGSRTKSGGPSSLSFPSGRRQVERLAPAFEELRTALGSEATSLRASAYATAPECVVVFETAGPVENFISAVQATGLDWLGEFDKEDIPPDDDFFNPGDRTATIAGRVFLVMANQRAIDQLLRLWKIFSTDDTTPFPHGSATLRTVFKQLRAVRRWDVSDRLADTGVLRVWRDDLALRRDVIRFEAELFYRHDGIKRGKARRAVEEAVQQRGGRIVAETIISEIGYHGLLLELAAPQVATVLDAWERGRVEDLRLVQTEDVMFFRPGAQSIAVRPLKTSEGAVHGTASEQPLPTGQPILALLDGLPVENHPLLAGRMVVDDPDGFESNYGVQHRRHGTAMASLMIHDELGSGQPVLSKPIYVRPILRPDEREGQNGRECMPQDQLPLDLLHRAIHRIVRGDGNGPVASGVRIVSLSLGDESRHFDGTVSPMARLLDWLAWKYKLLFVVSAGNHPREIDLGVADLRQMETGAIQAAVLKAVASDIRHRKLLSPAESINAVTVGAAHADRSTFMRVSRRHDPYSDKLPCPYSAVGLGHRRGIKPDILLPGGRQLLIEPPLQRNGSLVLETANFDCEPGQQVAAPNVMSTVQAATCFTRGTSNATALAARQAARICDTLSTLRDGANSVVLEDRFFPLITKALLAHGARWGDAYHTMKRILLADSDSKGFQEQVTRLIGYGLADPDRVMACTEQRATMIGCGLLKDGEAKVFKVPIPDSLSGRREWRRLTCTLAWFSPVSPTHRNYRKAALWFTDPTEPLKLQRQDADWQAVQRGTLQHEVFEGESAIAFPESSVLKLQVNCREDAGKLEEYVPFAVAVTFEVAESSAVPVYNEIRARVQPQVAIRAVG